MALSARCNFHCNKHVSLGSAAHTYLDIFLCLDSAAFDPQVRGGVRGSNSVAPGDKVLAALSGGEILVTVTLTAQRSSGLASPCYAHAGAASQAMLYFLQQMHNKDRGRLERGQVAFDLQAIHITEAGTNSSHTCHETAADQRQSGEAPPQLVTTCSKAGVSLTVAPLEAVFRATDQAIPLDTPSAMRHLQKDLHCLLQVAFQMHVLFT